MGEVKEIYYGDVAHFSMVARKLRMWLATGGQMFVSTWKRISRRRL
jgi:hypothetical protein